MNSSPRKGKTTWSEVSGGTDARAVPLRPSVPPPATHSSASCALHMLEHPPPERRLHCVWAPEVCSAILFIHDIPSDIRIPTPCPFFLLAKFIHAASSPVLQLVLVRGVHLHPSRHSRKICRDDQCKVVVDSPWQCRLWFQRNLVHALWSVSDLLSDQFVYLKVLIFFPFAYSWTNNVQQSECSPAVWT